MCQKFYSDRYYSFILAIALLAGLAAHAAPALAAPPPPERLTTAPGADPQTAAAASYATTINFKNSSLVSALSQEALKDPNYPSTVTLSSFTATAGQGRVRLAWETALEIDTLGFNIYRNTCPDDEHGWQMLNQYLIPAAARGSVLGQSYEYIDSTMQPGVTYYYWVEAISVDATQLFGPRAIFQSLFLPLVRK